MVGRMPIFGMFIRSGFCIRKFYRTEEDLGMARNCLSCRFLTLSMHSRPQIELSRQVRDSRYFSFNRGGRKSGVAVNLFFGGVEECNPEYEIKRTGFPVHILEYVEDGEGWVILDGEQHPLRTGCLFLYGPAIPCTILNTGRRPMKKYFLCLPNGRNGLGGGLRTPCTSVF